MWASYEVMVSRATCEVAAFLAEFGLQYDEASELTLEIRCGEKIVATGSLKGNVLQCIAVNHALQGEGLSGVIVQRLIAEAHRRGHTRVFIYTTPSQAHLFSSLGFRMLVKTQWAALLEFGYPSINEYLLGLETIAASCVVGEKGVIGGLVMNCNPFTLGHEHLVREAAARCAHVFLQVVEEERSAFPFAVRLALVRLGTQQFANVTVLSTGPYAVSAATFPSYFSAEETAHARTGASLDACMYGKYIAKTLRIQTRFVGTEPFSPVTAIYNQVLHEVLQDHGIQLREIERLGLGGVAISASQVRQAIRNDDFDSLARLVPTTTLAFLQSEEARAITQRLKTSVGRH